MSQHLHSQILNALMDAGEEGCSTASLAEQLGVSQQTIRNHFQQIEAEGTTLQKVGVHYALPPDFARQLFLTPAQMWLLYLPLRRLVRAQMQRYPLVNGLLTRIAQNLSQEIGEQITEPDVTSATDGQDRSLNDVFNPLVKGWQQELWVRIRYRSLGDAYTRLHTIAPWWFEPAVWSDSNYVLAGVQHAGGIQPMTFKLDRIEWVELTDQRFQRPAPDDVLNRIGLTWGIWQRDGAPTEVVLRFDNRVLDRLKETQWHPSQALSLDPDGRSIRWRAAIAEPAEMIPWIRGWGPDVEVLEPPSLREQIAQDTARTAALYGDGADEPQGYF
jgi:predicted DNA-binding transcriptional regulator YafY